ncbi:Reverse transcriptase domain-containing protein, partial [Aphis craccivora]
MNVHNINIIQWNLNGFWKKRSELEIIIRDFMPNILCLQETNFKGNQTPHFKNFRCYNKNRDDCRRASGGVAILIETSIPSEEVPIVTNLEAVAASFLTHNTITICNIYIPNHTDLILEEIDNIIKQLPTPFILTGDFNCHSELWGSEKTDDRGKIIEKILDDDRLVILNNGDPTR